MPRGITQKTKERKHHISEWAEQFHPVTVRQIFYRLSTLLLVPKTELGYKAVNNLCTQMHRNEEIPYDWFADNTRWQRRPPTYNSIQDAFIITAETYRRSLWQTQQGLVEIWLEKESLSGVVYPVIDKWDVPLMVVKGYPSLSFLYGAAEEIKKASSHGKTSHIFYFGDRDPSGVDIYRHTQKQLREFAPGADIQMEHVAFTETQIAAWNLPTRPTKKSDSRAKNFVGDSVELDAIPPDTLRELVEDCIRSVVDMRELEYTLEIERLEQESIPEILSQL